MRTILAITLLAAFAGGCKKQEKPAATGSGSASGTVGSGSADAGAGSATTGSGSGSDAGSGGGGSAAALPPGAVRVQGEFATPESVLYDAASDVYLVANINGAPTAIDDNGFISKVSPDGAVVAMKWIDGAAADIKLDAPKGMAIAGGMLYVADVTRVRKFDLKTGKAAGDIELAGSTFVNDVVASPDGKTIYATDTGVDGSFSPNGTDAVWKIAGDKPVALARDKALGNPNGIVTSPDGGSVWIATFGTGELREISGKGELKGATKLPKGKLDGVAWVGDTLLVSSWESATVYQGTPAGEWKAVVTGVEAPADIGYDSKRKVVLVPRFMTNDVLLVPLK